MKAVLASLFCAVSAAAYFEDFSGDWESRWVQSKSGSDLGKFQVTAGKFSGDAEINKGLQTSQDAKFYHIASKFPKVVDGTKDKLVIQMTVKHEQSIDCGGGYVKVMSSEANLDQFDGNTDYNVMFGPDICGPPKKMIHIIFNHEGKNLLWKKEEKAPDDTLTHMYTLIVDPKAQTYELQVDGEKKADGNLEDDWDFLAPKEIDDPEDKKPTDWVDEAEIDDPEDSKPEDWDNVQAQISDPDAEKPEDWDEEDDGAWEAPMIPNPEYKGEWKAKRIPNPEYKGVWKPARIANPDYKASSTLATYKDFGAAGFDLWQVKSGTIFDNLYVGDSVAEAKEYAEKTYFATIDAEKKAKELIDEQERKLAEEAAKAAEAAKPEEAADEDEDEDDEL
jgi:calreticulin